MATNPLRSLDELEALIRASHISEFDLWERLQEETKIKRWSELSKKYADVPGPSTGEFVGRRSLSDRAPFSPELAKELEELEKSSSKAERKLKKLELKRPFEKGRRRLVATDLAKLRRELKPGKGRVAHRWERVRKLSPEFSKFNTGSLGSKIAIDVINELDIEDFSRHNWLTGKSIPLKEGLKAELLSKAEKRTLTTRNLRRLTDTELDELINPRFGWKKLGPGGLTKALAEKARRMEELANKILSRRGVMGKTVEAMVKPRLPKVTTASGAGTKLADLAVRILTRGRKGL